MKIIVAAIIFQDLFIVYFGKRIIYIPSQPKYAYRWTNWLWNSFAIRKTVSKKYEIGC